MEVLSDETRAKLKAIAARIDELNSQIKELNSQIKELQQEAYDLVPKHTFDECKEMKCIHTYRNRWDCHRSCVRRKNEMGNLEDYYEKEQPVFKPKVEYPTLGWKKVTAPGLKWNGEWTIYAGEVKAGNERCGWRRNPGHLGFIEVTG